MLKYLKILARIRMKEFRVYSVQCGKHQTETCCYSLIEATQLAMHSDLWCPECLRERGRPPPQDLT